MKETQFIKQNKEKWLQFEDILAKKDGRIRRHDADDISDLFIQLTDDLSYSRTFYGNRMVHYYLNNIAQKIFYSVYKDKKKPFAGFYKFCTEDVPLAMYEAKTAFLISALVFILSLIVGILSSIYNPDFYNIILGEDYVRMTMENIKNEDPMAVYKSMNQSEMFLGITYNNISVAFNTYVFGLLASIGSIFILLYNGIMVGSFQYFFYEQGLFRESFLTIWMHGTLEISAIIIAGAAGIYLGKGLLFPGTFSRLRAFQISAGKSLKIIIGTIPLFIIAGFIEGFVTRHTDLPDVMRLVFIIACLAFILFYFVWYPYKKGKGKSLEELYEKQTLQSVQIQSFELDSIKNNSQILANVFLLYRQSFVSQLIVSFVLASIYTLGAYFLFTITEQDVFNIDSFFLKNLSVLYSYEAGKWIYALNLFCLVSIVIYCFHRLFELTKNKSLFSDDKPVSVLSDLGRFLIRQKELILYTFVLMGISLLIAMPYDFLYILFSLLFFSYTVFVLYIYRQENGNVLISMMRGTKLLKGYWADFIGLISIIFIMAGIYMFLFNSPLNSTIFEMISINFNLSFDGQRQLSFIFLCFVLQFGLNMTLPLFIYGVIFLYHSQREIIEAPWLTEKIQNFA